MGLLRKASIPIHYNEYMYTFICINKIVNI